MPQLKKVILAIGNTLIYRDTYEQGLGDLSGLMQGGTVGAVPPVVASASPRRHTAGRTRPLEGIDPKPSSPGAGTCRARQMG